MSLHKVAVVGALGRMGERVRAAVAEHPDLALGAAIEAPGHPGLGTRVDGVVVTDDGASAIRGCDVVVDFSVPEATLALLRAAARSGTAYVTGTTGLSESQARELARLAEQIPVIHAPNFSLAVNVLAWLVRETSKRLGRDFDAEIVELHHAAKRDAPSGTALRLAQAVADGRGDELAKHLVLERAGEIGPRPPAAIGVQTLRGGDSPGEHTVLFMGRGERLELTHRAFTRDHFARGAVRAAAWLVGRGPGLHPIEDVLDLS